MQRRNKAAEIEWLPILAPPVSRLSFAVAAYVSSPAVRVVREGRKKIQEGRTTDKGTGQKKFSDLAPLSTTKKR